MADNIYQKEDGSIDIEYLMQDIAQYLTSHEENLGCTDQLAEASFSAIRQLGVKNKKLEEENKKLRLKSKTVIKTEPRKIS